VDFLNRIGAAKAAAIPSGVEAAEALRAYVREAGVRIAALPETEAILTGAALEIDGLLQDLLAELDACGPAPISPDLDARAMAACRAIDRTLDFLAPGDNV
jgi:hypothetical protein